MSDRVILALKYTPAGAASQVRKAVGGFLRYVQHRDVHPTQSGSQSRPEVSGLLKYVAYRDRATNRAELFGPAGTLSSAERKAFASFVASAIEGSRPQLYRGRDGAMQDRRRAVYRMVISPEHASGLDLRELTGAAVRQLECESGEGLRWIAAIHRNTAHHHVHLVLSGMREDGQGGFTRVDISNAHLAAMKVALVVEIERQREERAPSREPARHAAPTSASDFTAMSFEAAPVVHQVGLARTPLRVAVRGSHRWHLPHPGLNSSVIALRAVARRYQRQMERELEQGYRQGRWERAA
jgi:relaxase-like protein